jgi:hypothetical protein
VARYPTTLLLGARGCGELRDLRDRSAYGHLSPDAAGVSISGSWRPTFVIGSFCARSSLHDPRMGGMPRTIRFFSLVEALRPRNEVVFELSIRRRRVLRARRAGVPAWAPKSRWNAGRTNPPREGKFPGQRRAQRTIDRALPGCRKPTSSSWSGCPASDTATPTTSPPTRASARALQRRDAHPFVAPLGPFSIRESREEQAFGYWCSAGRSRSPARVPA